MGLVMPWQWRTEDPQTISGCQQGGTKSCWRQTIKQHKDSLKTDFRICSIRLQSWETVTKTCSCVYLNTIIRQRRGAIESTCIELNENLGIRAECKAVPCSYSLNPFPLFGTNQHFESMWQNKHLSRSLQKEPRTSQPTSVWALTLLQMAGWC